MSLELEALREDDYPHDAVGSCLIFGTPPAHKADEAKPIDLVRATLYAVAKTKANLDDPAAKTRVEVAGLMPCSLVIEQGNVLAALEKRSPDPQRDRTLKTLRRIEKEEALLIKAIRDEFQLQDCLEVVTFTDKFEREDDIRMWFIPAWHHAQAHLHEPLKILQESGVVEEKTLKQALLDIMPSWVKQPQADKTSIEQRINYALMELIWILRKISEGILFFHYERERSLLPIAKAYAEQCLRMNGQLIDSHVRMPREIEGIKLLTRARVEKVLKKHADVNPDEIRTRLRRAEPYRVGPGQTNLRFLLRPADRPEVMGKKLNPEDNNIEIVESINYIRDAVLPILRLVRLLAQEQDRKPMIRKLEAAVPQNVITNFYDPKNQERILDALYDIVLAPVNEAYDYLLSLEDRNRTPSSGMAPIGWSEGETEFDDDDIDL